jgi:hypothetical protein
MRTLVIVRFPVQRALPAAELAVLLEATAPKYLSIPGLLRKYFIAVPGEGGGVYEWQDRASALGYHDDSWRERMRELYGTAPLVEFMDLPCVVDSVRATIERD